MYLKRHWLAFLLLAAGALGGAHGGRLSREGDVARAAAAEARSATDGQQWEYCTITRAGYSAAASRSGVYWITYYRKAGPQVVDVEDNVTTNAALAKAIARLGEEGWEMVGVGPIELRVGKTDALYFKRPKQ